MSFNELLAIIGRYSVYAVTTFVFAGVGALVGSYLNKKGENRAIHEDIGKLVDQMKAVTQATKEIESKISTDAWERQRKWDVKRGTLFELIKNIGTLASSLGTLDATFRGVRDARLQDPAYDEAVWSKRRSEATASYNAANLEFEKVSMLASIICGKELNAALDYLKSLNDKSLRYLRERDFDSYHKMFDDTLASLKALKEEIRKELRL